MIRRPRCRQAGHLAQAAPRRGYAGLLLAVTITLLVSVSGVGSARHVVAKGDVNGVWLVGGDLPHSVRIPTEEVLNAGTDGGESTTGGFQVPAEDPGPGYDILPGDDLDAATGDLLSYECCETYYPRGAGPGLLQYWKPLTRTYSVRPADREQRGWSRVSGGLFDVFRRYVGLAKAGLIGQHPTLGEGLAASSRLANFQVTIVRGRLGHAGTPLTARDAASFMRSFESLKRRQIELLGNEPQESSVHLLIHFGTANGQGGLQFVYAPPGVSAEKGLLIPQLRTAPSPSSADSLMAAYQTTRELDGLLTQYSAETANAAGSPTAGQLPSLGSGGRLGFAAFRRWPLVPLTVLLGLGSGIIGAWCLEMGRRGKASK